MRLPSRKSRVAVLIVAPAVAVLGIGSAFAVNAAVTNTKQLSSGTAAISGCDSEYKVTLANPTYNAAVKDYVVATAATDSLEDSCIGQTIVLTVINDSNAVVTDGSATIANNKIGTVTFATPLPVGTAYTVKSAIFGTRAGS